MEENTKILYERDIGLSNLIRSTVTSLTTSIKSERAIKLQNAVATYVKMFLAEVTNIEPMFKPSEVIQVGSYAEGTKILEPDEFDFLVVIKELSKPGAVAINNDPEKVKGRTNLPSTGYVTLAVADDILKSKWKKYCENGLLQCFQYSLRNARFGSLFMKGIRKFCDRSCTKPKEKSFTFVSAVDIDFLKCTALMPEVDGISLKFSRAEFKTPNLLLYFEYEDLEIGVDVSPAIRYDKVSDCFSPEKCFHSHLSDAILSRESLLLVANENFDFRITVTEAEVNFIKSKMKKQHKNLYIFLKYINTLFSSSKIRHSPFSSYMLKNICLRHDFNCHTETREEAVCLNLVLEDMKELCAKNEIPSVVNSDINLAAKSSIFDDFKFKDYMIEVLLQLCNKSKDISSVTEFNELLDDAVGEASSKFMSTCSQKLASDKDIVL